jgi:hypothetical protein
MRNQGRLAAEPGRPSTNASGSTTTGKYTNTNITPSPKGSILSTHYEPGGLLPRQ